MTKRNVLIGLVAMVATYAFLVDPMIYGVTVIHLTAIPAIAFPWVYRTAPWRNGPTGRALMNKALSVALLFAVSVLGFWVPYDGFIYLNAAVVSYLGVSITYQFIVMRRVKKLGASRMPAPEGASQP